MKVVQRGIMKVLPGKIAEAMELLEKHMAIVARMMEIPQERFPMRTYRPFIGGGDSLHTVIFEIEWDSLAAMADFFEKVMSEPEMQALMPKWEAVEESHEVEVYMLMP
jgi:hypothetical protein